MGNMYGCNNYYDKDRLDKEIQERNNEAKQYCDSAEDDELKPLKIRRYQLNIDSQKNCQSTTFPFGKILKNIQDEVIELHFSGKCECKTKKDINFFGLNDRIVSVEEIENLK